MGFELLNFYQLHDHFRTGDIRSSGEVTEVKRVMHSFTDPRAETILLYDLMREQTRNRESAFRLERRSPTNELAEVQLLVPDQQFEVLSYAGKPAPKEYKVYGLKRELRYVEERMAGGAAHNCDKHYHDHGGKSVIALEQKFYDGTDEPLIVEYVRRFREGIMQEETFYDVNGNITLERYYATALQGGRAESVITGAVAYDETGRISQKDSYYNDGTIKEEEIFDQDGDRSKERHYRPDGTLDYVSRYQPNGRHILEQFDETGLILEWKNIYRNNQRHIRVEYYDGDPSKEKYRCLYHNIGGETPFYVAYKEIRRDEGGNITYIGNIAYEGNTSHPKNYEPRKHFFADYWSFGNEDGDVFNNSGGAAENIEHFFLPDNEGGSLYFQRIVRDGDFGKEPHEERWFDSEGNIYQRIGYYTNDHRKIEEKYEMVTIDGVERMVPGQRTVYARDDGETVIYHAEYKDGKLAIELKRGAAVEGHVESITNEYEGGALTRATVEYIDGGREELYYSPERRTRVVRRAEVDVDAHNNKTVTHVVEEQEYFIPHLIRQEHYEDDVLVASFDHELVADGVIRHADAPPDYFTERREQQERQQQLFRGAANVDLIDLHTGVQAGTYSGEISLTLVASSEAEMERVQARLQHKEPDLRFERHRIEADTPGTYFFAMTVERRYAERGHFDHYPYAPTAADARVESNEINIIRREMEELIRDVFRYSHCNTGLYAYTNLTHGNSPPAVFCTLSHEFPMAGTESADILIAAMEPVIRRALPAGIRVIPHEYGEEIIMQDKRPATHPDVVGKSNAEREADMIRLVNDFLQPPVRAREI